MAAIIKTASVFWLCVTRIFGGIYFVDHFARDDVRFHLRARGACVTCIVRHLQNMATCWRALNAALSSSSLAYSSCARNDFHAFSFANT